MKCSLVVNQLNDPFYIDYDEEFARYIIATSKEKGLLEEDAVVTELDANLVMQLFSPLVLSQWLLIDQTKEPCSSVSCPNGFCFVFRHVDGLLFLTINGDSTESEEFLHRKIQIFIRLMKFLFGPVSEEIGQSQYTSKKAKWEFLRCLMKTWSELVATEQAFLVEAIERLNVNQLVSEKCIEILEKSVKQIQASQDHPTQHAVLLVNSKLLALYSNRGAHELRPKDILSLMILSKTMYPRTDRLEDLFSKQYSSKKSIPNNDDNSDGGEDEYHSAPATPEFERRSRAFSENSDDGQENIVSPQSKRNESDTDTIINSMTSLSNTVDPVISNQNVSEKKDMTLVDMYKEKYSDLGTVDQGAETDGTETTQEIICVDHVIVADVHNEQGTFSFVDESPLSLNELPSIERAKSEEEMGGNDFLHSDAYNEKFSDIDKSKIKEYAEEKNEIDKSLDNEKALSGNYTDQPEVKEETNEISKVDMNLAADNEKALSGNDTSQPEVKEQTDGSSIVDTSLATDDKKALSNSNLNQSEGKEEADDKSKNDELLMGGNDNALLEDMKLTCEESSTMDFQQNISKNVFEAKGDFSEKSSDTTSIASSAGFMKERSRASTLSSGLGEGSAIEECSLPSIQSTTSSVLSNISKSYPELSLQTGSDAAILDANLPVKLREAKNNKRNAEFRHSRTSPRFNARTKRVPTPTNAVENSHFTIDTMQSMLNSQGSGTYLPQTVFLETSTCNYSPHNVHTAQILPGVTLVLLSQAPRHILADPLYQVMSNIQDLIYGRRTKLLRQRSLHVYEIINSLLGKLHNSLRKFKGRERTLISDIHGRWEKEDVKHKLLEYLEKDSRFQIPPEVESPLMEMYKKLRELFSLLYLCPLPDNPQLWESISHLRVAINAELLDYREYLNVKSQRNITMTSYFEKFPGLIHFIFIDRRLHQMTVPSLNISLKEGEKSNTSSYLKDNIWRLYQHMMVKLTEGYTTVILREGDFYYSYFLWFEDSAGNALPVQESFKPSNKLPYPGILCGSFYRDVTQQCFPQMVRNSVFCFEMFMMHVGSVHPQYIASHCKKLAAELWEMSGDSYSTLSLF